MNKNHQKKTKKPWDALSHSKWPSGGDVHTTLALVDHRLPAIQEQETLRDMATKQEA